MTQDELNKIPPPPDPANFHRLEVNKTMVLAADSQGCVTMTITLRKIEDGVAYVQLTHDPRVPQIPKRSLRPWEN